MAQIATLLPPDVRAKLHGVNGALPWRHSDWKQLPRPIDAHRTRDTWDGFPVVAVGWFESHHRRACEVIAAAARRQSEIAERLPATQPDSRSPIAPSAKGHDGRSTDCR